jgi:hypothetical protein
MKIREIVAVLVVAAIGFGITIQKSPDAIKNIDLAGLIKGGPEISKEAEAHILHGDKTGGGHLYGTGKDCKSEFPKDWDESEILGNIKKVAANDNLKWKKQRNGYYVATDKIDDVKVKVVLDKEKDGVVTAYPVGGKLNACNKAKPARSARKKAPAPEPVVAEVEKAKQLPNATTRQPRTQNFNSAN